eukprot:scaffold1847_cov131-Isochrysis_galbana.AAC.5
MDTGCSSSGGSGSGAERARAVAKGASVANHGPHGKEEEKWPIGMRWRAHPGRTTAERHVRACMHAICVLIRLLLTVCCATIRQVLCRRRPPKFDGAIVCACQHLEPPGITRNGGDGATCSGEPCHLRRLHQVPHVQEAVL